MENPLPVDWKLLANIGIPLNVFVFLSFNDSLRYKIFPWVFGSLRSSLLCIIGELAGGVSVAVAVALVTSDR